MRSWQDECAIFGIWNHPEASRMVYLGLYALQHRGQEASGIVSLYEKMHLEHKGFGLVADVFQEEDLDRLKGTTAIGHNRYSTTGENQKFNIQPLKAVLFNGPVSLAHNGNIVNSHILRRELQAQGSIFQGTNDTEILLHLVSRNPSNDLIECLKAELPKLEGAYSMVMMSQTAMVGMRDPYGFRPLVLGKLKHDSGMSWVLASETCAFDLIGAEFVREIEPGEIFWCDENGAYTVNFAEKKTPRPCVFEYVYFARPDSRVFGKSVYEVRKELGRQLARENGVDADIVIPVPDSGVPAALGYSEASGIPFELGIIRNHYIGRTFIEPKQSIRSFGVKIKLNPQLAILKNKRVVVVDDSIVRGTTSKKIVGLIRQFGAKEVHMRIAAPPTISPCFYGVDTPKKNDLIAATTSLEEIREYIGADSLAYVSNEGLLKASQSETTKTFCDACFSETYPTPTYD
ncbi:MAG: amidophosphoribosyltransferase [Bdellovibrionaceae bacterium]|nr:amidophosphoribosyltransferase [Pseudobdellovibrionaceae bacterium]